MKLKNRFIPILCLVFLSNFALAKVKIVSKKIPLELRTLVETLDKSRLKPEQRAHFHQVLKKIDLLLEQTPREYVLIIAKAEIYKHLLELKFNQAISYQYFNEANVLKAKSKLSEHALAYSPFLWWVLSAIIKDMQDLLAEVSFKNRLIKANPEAEGRLKILTPWLVQINNLVPAELNSIVVPHLLDSLERLETYLRALTLTTPFSNVKPVAGLNFAIDAGPEGPSETKKNGPNEAKEVEIIDQVIEQKKSTPAPTSRPKAEWTPAGDSE